jgi:hypothetical protein
MDVLASPLTASQLRPIAILQTVYDGVENRAVVLLASAESSDNATI